MSDLVPNLILWECFLDWIFI